MELWRQLDRHAVAVAVEIDSLAQTLRWIVVVMLTSWVSHIVVVVAAAAVHQEDQ